MGLLSSIKKGMGGEEQQMPPTSPPAQTEEARREERATPDRIRVGHVHLCGCTGCVVALTDIYQGLFKVLDDYVDWVYGTTIADVRRIPEMDVALVEGAVCLQDHEQIQDLRTTRLQSKLVVAIGSCACTGNILRFSRGGQVNQPQHESFAPISDLVDVDVHIPTCAPTPQQIRNTIVMAYLLLKGTDDQKALAGRWLKPMMDLARTPFYQKASFNTLMQEVINQGLCMGCGTCAASCPVRAISMEFGKPNGTRDLCINCGACYAQCPRSFFDHDLMEQHESIMELIQGAMAPK
ncbi:MAG: coenzyme F420 hydrogenase subunit gamma [Methanomicrobiales archaeon]|nr:coenzyme F420 hydrogenase subunit gamma [Methanomicrobiales archaeon]